MAGCEFGHHGHRNTGSFIISDKFRLSNPLPSYMGKKKKGVTSIYTSWPVWWTPFTFYYLRWKSGITDILGYLSRCWTKTFFFFRNPQHDSRTEALYPVSSIPQEKNGSLSENSRFTLHFIVSIPRVNENFCDATKGLRDTGASRNGFTVKARGTVTGDNHHCSFS